MMIVPVTATIGTHIIVTFVGSLTKSLEIVEVDEIVAGVELVVTDGAGVVVVIIGGAEVVGVVVVVVVRIEVVVVV